MKAIGYFCNGIGNLVMMMPALQAVASMTGENKIDVVLGEWTDNRQPACEDILKNWSYTGKIFNPPYHFNPKDYDLWYFSPHGKNIDVTHLFRDRGVPVAKPSWRNSMAHEIDHYMQIAYALGYKGKIPKLAFPMSNNGVGVGDVKRPLIGVCNGFFKTDYWKKKSWPHFRELVKVMRLYFGGTVIGIGGEGELQDIGLDPALNFCGKTSILETSKLLSYLDMFITTDTGNMHIADALDIPIIALFGSTLVSKNAPRGKKSLVLASGADCAPCQDTGRSYSCKDYLCMKSISVGDVMAVLKTIL
jgi:ADP-heptose:LPS heptosyltransferase